MRKKSICGGGLFPTLSGSGLFRPSHQKASQEPGTGLVLTQFWGFHSGLIHLSEPPMWRVFNRVLRLSDGLLRGNESGWSAVHLAKDYPLKGRDGDGDEEKE